MVKQEKKIFSLYLTLDEHEFIEKKAIEEGLSKTAFVRMLVKQAEKKDKK